MYKTKLKSVIKKIIYPFLVLKNGAKTVQMDPSEAVGILENTSPKPEGVIEANNQLNIKYDLMIVIPAYNVEKYIKVCIESVLKQKTRYSYEVVIVDDGSTDMTGKIIDEFSECKFVRIIHQENRGLSGARNRALEIITGKYVTFLDSDDYLVEGALDILLDLAYQNNADIAEGAMYDFVDGGRIIDKHFHAQIGIGRASEILTGFAGGKLYKAELFADIQFPEGYWYEDTILSMVIYWNVQKAVTTNKIVYAYRQNPLGITKSSVGKAKAIDTFWITALCLEKKRKDKKPFTVEVRKQFLQQVWMNYIRTQRLSDQVQQANFGATAQIYADYFAFDNMGELSKKEKQLSKVLQTLNYGKYRAMMKCWSDI